MVGTAERRMIPLELQADHAERFLGEGARVLVEKEVARRDAEGVLGPVPRPILLGCTQSPVSEDLNPEEAGPAGRIQIQKISVHEGYLRLQRLVHQGSTVREANELGYLVHSVQVQDPARARARVRVRGTVGVELAVPQERVQESATFRSPRYSSLAQTRIPC